MALTREIAIDLAKVYSSPNGRTPVVTLAWGDRVEVVETTEKHVEIELTRFRETEDGSFEPVKAKGFIRPTKKSKLEPEDCVALPSKVDVLKIDFVDVQQGDGAVIETPGGKIVLVDGGDNQLFARYLAARYRGSSDEDPQEVDAIVVSHGDADHFKGLTEIHASETHSAKHKRLFLHPARVYHNGLVKRPGKRPDGSDRPDKEMFGETATDADGRLVATELVTNPSSVANSKLNAPFRAWKKALKAWRKRGPIAYRRLERGDDDAFDFLAGEDITVEVLGPMTTKAGGKDGLVFLGKPKSKVRLGHESLSLGSDAFTGTSASHTINGHSILLRLTYGRLRVLFSGDLNDEASRTLTKAHNAGEIDLTAEVLKAPHHGSADFSAAFLEAVSPMVSVVSSGDEDASKEHIHPRATLVGALGKYSRTAEPLVFVTELVAFFKKVGFITEEKHDLDRNGELQFDANGDVLLEKNTKGRFFAFQRTAFGIVKIRSDGQRILVYTNSGKESLKEAYAFAPDEDTGELVPTAVRAI